MRIRTYKNIDYWEGCKIYYRSFLNHFEYLTAINGEIYTAHITVKPTLINKILYWLGIEKQEYSEQQLQSILTSLKRMAETTIETALHFNKDEAEIEKKIN